MANKTLTLKRLKGVSYVEAITFSENLSQLIHHPRHILSNSSFHIDIIFINQTSFIRDAGIEPS